MSVGDWVRHPDHSNEVEITEIDGDMIAFTVHPPMGGAYRMWNHKARFNGRLW